MYSTKLSSNFFFKGGTRAVGILFTVGLEEHGVIASERNMSFKMKRRDERIFFLFWSNYIYIA